MDAQAPSLQEMRWGLMSPTLATRIESLADFLTLLPKKIVEGNSFTAAVFDAKSGILEKRFPLHLLNEAVEFALLALESPSDPVVLAALYMNAVGEAYEKGVELEKVTKKLDLRIAIQILKNNQKKDTDAEAEKRKREEAERMDELQELQFLAVEGLLMDAKVRYENLEKEMEKLSARAKTYKASRDQAKALNNELKNAILTLKYIQRKATAEKKHQLEELHQLASAEKARREEVERLLKDAQAKVDESLNLKKENSDLKKDLQDLKAKIDSPNYKQQYLDALAETKKLEAQVSDLESRLAPEKKERLMTEEALKPADYGNNRNLLLGNFGCVLDSCTVEKDKILGHQNVEEEAEHLSNDAQAEVEESEPMSVIGHIKAQLIKDLMNFRVDSCAGDFRDRCTVEKDKILGNRKVDESSNDGSFEDCGVESEESSEDDYEEVSQEEKASVDVRAMENLAAANEALKNLKVPVCVNKSASEASTSPFSVKSLLFSESSIEVIELEDDLDE